MNKLYTQQLVMVYLKRLQLRKGVSFIDKGSCLLNKTLWLGTLSSMHEREDSSKTLIGHERVNKKEQQWRTMLKIYN